MFRIFNSVKQQPQDNLNEQMNVMGGFANNSNMLCTAENVPEADEDHEVQAVQQPRTNSPNYHNHTTSSENRDNTSNDLSSTNTDTAVICAVYNCGVGLHSKNQWEEERCEIHTGMTHGICACVYPYMWCPFPKDNMQQRRIWTELINYTYIITGEDWQPQENSRVCSKHFIDGKPTDSHPFPTINMNLSTMHTTKANSKANNMTTAMIQTITRETTSHLEKPAQLEPQKHFITYPSGKAFLLKPPTTSKASIASPVSSTDVSTQEADSTVDNVLQAGEGKKTVPTNTLAEYGPSAEDYVKSLERIYSCRVCSYKCKEKAIMEKHREVHIGQKIFKCPVTACARLFTFPRRLKSHVKTQHPGEYVFQCPYCKFGCDTQRHFKSHSQHTHSSTVRTYKCKQCSNSYETIAGLTTHLSTHSNKQPFKCELCNFASKYPHSLGRHLKRWHPVEYMYKCSFCTFECKTPGRFKSHLQDTHPSAVPTFTCKQCKVTYKTIQGLNRHNLTHAQTQSHSEMSEVDMDPERLSEVDMDQELLSEVDVDQELLSEVDVDQELLGEVDMDPEPREVHIGLELFKCPVGGCALALTSKKLLKSHVKTQHPGEYIYQCSFCQFGCDTQGAFKVHSRKHSNVKPFKCKKCSLAFKSIGALNNHVYTHSLTRPFKCKECNFATKHPSCLTVHTLTHSKTKPFLCNFCTYRTKTRYCLTIHLRLHSGVRPYKCPYCAYTAVQRTACSAHVLKKHQGMLLRVERTEVKKDPVLTRSSIQRSSCKKRVNKKGKSLKVATSESKKDPVLIHTSPPRSNCKKSVNKEHQTKSLKVGTSESKNNSLLTDTSIETTNRQTDANKKHVDKEQPAKILQIETPKSKNDSVPTHASIQKPNFKNWKIIAVRKS